MSWQENVPVLKVDGKTVLPKTVDGGFAGKLSPDWSPASCRKAMSRARRRRAQSGFEGGAAPEKFSLRLFFLRSLLLVFFDFDIFMEQDDFQELCFRNFRFF